jgi:hypothetical protein
MGLGVIVAVDGRVARVYVRLVVKRVDRFCFIRQNAVHTFICSDAEPIVAKAALGLSASS